MPFKKSWTKLNTAIPKFSQAASILTRVEYRKGRGGRSGYMFNTKSHLHPVDYLKLLQKTIQKEFEDGRYQDRSCLSQKEFAAGLEADKDMMENFVRDFLVYTKNSLFFPLHQIAFVESAKGKASAFGFPG